MILGEASTLIRLEWTRLGVAYIPGAQGTHRDMVRWEQQCHLFGFIGWEGAGGLLLAGFR